MRKGRYGGRRGRERKCRSCGGNWSYESMYGRSIENGEKEQGKVDKKQIRRY